MQNMNFLLSYKLTCITLLSIFSCNCSTGQKFNRCWGRRSKDWNG